MTRRGRDKDTCTCVYQTRGPGTGPAPSGSHTSLLPPRLGCSVWPSSHCPQGPRPRCGGRAPHSLPSWVNRVRETLTDRRPRTGYLRPWLSAGRPSGYVGEKHQGRGASSAPPQGPRCVETAPPHRGAWPVRTLIPETQVQIPPATGTLLTAGAAPAGSAALGQWNPSWARRFRAGSRGCVHSSGTTKVTRMCTSTGRAM